MIRMKATKQLTYRTRRLLADGSTEMVSALMPGDVFEVFKHRDLKVILAKKAAVELREPVEVPPPPPEVAAKIEAAVAPVRKPTTFIEEPYAGESPPPAGAMSTADSGLVAGVADDLAAARADYEKAIGKRPFHGWDVETLRKKIAEKGES